MSSVVRLTNLGPLHDLMLRACPPDNETSVRSIPTLAKAMEYSSQALYKMIRKNKVSPEAARKIVQVSNGAVSLEDFHPYVYA